MISASLAASSIIEYVYCVTSDVLLAYKIGMWRSSSQESLRLLYTRYQTCYGNTVQFVIFQCPPGRAFSIERTLHRDLNKHNICNELFDKKLEVLNSYCTIATQHALLFCDKTRPPFRTRNQKEICKPVPILIVPPRQDNLILHEFRTAKKQKQIDILMKEPVVPVDEYLDIQHRLVNRQGTAQDKLAHYRFMYAKAWGIDYINEDFLKTNGIKMGSKNVELCINILFPSLQEELDIESADQSWTQIKLIQEVLDTLGFRHPFDFEVRVSAEEVHPKLLKTHMFLNYNESIQLFDTTAKTDKQFEDIKDVTETLQTVLSAIGLKLTSKSERKRFGKKVQTRFYTYSIDTEQARKTAALVNLKMQDEQRMSQYFDAQQFLKQVGYGQWHNLVTSKDHLLIQ